MCYYLCACATCEAVHQGCCLPVTRLDGIDAACCARGACAGREDRYEAFLQEVVARTARLVAHWQAVGFVHGVCNTDNFSILGETIDYGCAP